MAKLVFGFNRQRAQQLADLADQAGIVPNPRVHTSYEQAGFRTTVVRTYLVQPLARIGHAILQAGNIALGEGDVYIIKKRHDDSGAHSQLEYHRDELDQKVIRSAFNYTGSAVGHDGNGSIDIESTSGTSEASSSSSSSSSSENLVLAVAIEDVFGDLYIVQSVGGSGGSGDSLEVCPAKLNNVLLADLLTTVKPRDIHYLVGFDASNCLKKAPTANCPCHNDSSSSSSSVGG